MLAFELSSGKFVVPGGLGVVLDSGSKFEVDKLKVTSAGKFSGIELAACGNTLKAQEITVKDLLPGFTVDERGGVVRIAELQMQGYAYIRP